MDYKNRMENQYGAGKLDSGFIEKLSNLAFVVGDNILGDDAHAVILCLIKEFDRISDLNIKHNLELSQYYALGKALTSQRGLSVCENCEIVLRYVDTTVCISDGRVRKHVSEEDGKYYHTSKFGEKTQIDCTINRGVVRLYIKQKDGNMYKYTRIRVVSMEIVDSLNKFYNAIYQDDDEIRKLEDASSIAMSKGQTGAYSSSSKRGRLETITSQDIENATNTINDIVDQTKNSVFGAQLGKITNQRGISTVPNQTSVNAANTVAKSIMNTPNANNMSAIVVPNNEPMLLKETSNTTAVIDNNGIKTNIKNINSRASLAVDSNIAVVPTNKVLEDKNITVTAPSGESKTASSNKLLEGIKNFASNTGQTVSELANKVKSIFTGTGATPGAAATTATRSASVVPVAENLGVFTPLTATQAASTVPVAQNDFLSAIRNYGSSLLSQNSIVKKFDSKLARANGSSISIDSNNRASTIARNGNTSMSKVHNSNVRNNNASNMAITNASDTNNFNASDINNSNASNAANTNAWNTSRTNNANASNTARTNNANASNMNNFNVSSIANSDAWNISDANVSDITDNNTQARSRSNNYNARNGY